MLEEADNQNVTEQEAVVPVEATDSQDQKAVSIPEVGSKEYNFRAMEQRNAQLATEVEELKKMVNDRTIDESSTELTKLQDDDLITVGQVNKLADERAKKIIQDELNKRDRAQLPNITKSQYSDYDQVVTNDNVLKLIQEDPDLEYDIRVAKNPYSRTYKAIMNSKFYRDQTATQVNQTKIEKNSQKPVSSNSVGRQSPLTQAKSFMRGTPELFAEMQNLRGGSI